MNYQYKTNHREDIDNEEYECLICKHLTYSHHGASEHFILKHMKKSGRFDITQGGSIEYCDDGEFIAFDEIDGWIEK